MNLKKPWTSAESASQLLEIPPRSRKKTEQAKHDLECLSLSLSLSFFRSSFNQRRNNINPAIGSMFSYKKHHHHRHIPLDQALQCTQNQIEMAKMARRKVGPRRGANPGDEVRLRGGRGQDRRQRRKEEGRKQVRKNERTNEGQSLQE